MPKFTWLLSLLLITGLSGSVQAQKKLVWPMLSLTTYDIDMSNNEVNYKPRFPDRLTEDYEGEEVEISGYLIPMDVDARQYALSQNPFSSCFFCGGAGPETVIELRFTSAPGRFATDEYVAVSGRLVLNRRGQGLFFTLQNARIEG